MVGLFCFISVVVGTRLFAFVPIGTFAVIDLDRVCTKRPFGTPYASSAFITSKALYGSRLQWKSYLQLF